MRAAQRTLSIVVPCFNEEQVIGEMHRRLVGTVDAIPELDFEIVYVDDGSRDATLKLLREIRQADVRVRVLVLSRNFGHQIAITAGLQHASGDAVVVVDADLQDPPEVIPDMLNLWHHGTDVAYGVRIGRSGETAFKRWTASAFYRLMDRLTDISIPLDAGDFRLMDRRVVDAFLAMPERDRFIRGMVTWTGFHQEPVPYQRAPRAMGRTKYPIRKMLRFAADGILSFSPAPLKLAVWFGLTASGLAFLGIVYAIGMRIFTDIWVTGWTLLFIAILFFGGTQLVLIGVLGEYLSRIGFESGTNRRPDWKPDMHRDGTAGG